MPNTELAEELLQLEEADAWFEYLESTRGQTETRYARARAVGLGAAFAAPSRRTCATGATPACGRMTRAVATRPCRGPTG